MCTDQTLIGLYIYHGELRTYKQAPAVASAEKALPLPPGPGQCCCGSDPGYLDIFISLALGRGMTSWFPPDGWSHVNPSPGAPLKTLGSVPKLSSLWPLRGSSYDTPLGIWQILPQSSSHTRSGTDLHSPLARAQRPTAIDTYLGPIFGLRGENPEKPASQGREENWCGGSPRMVSPESWRREGC